MNHEQCLVGLTEALDRDQRFAAAILFGSIARGTARPDSDVDVGVLYACDDARAAANAGLIDLLGQLGITARRNVHLVDLLHADSALRRSIFASGRILFDRSGRALRDLKVNTLLEYFDWAYARSVIDESHRRQLGLVRG